MGLIVCCGVTFEPFGEVGRAMSMQCVFFGFLVGGEREGRRQAAEVGDEAWRLQGTGYARCLSLHIPCVVIHIEEHPRHAWIFLLLPRILFHLVFLLQCFRCNTVQHGAW